MGLNSRTLFLSICLLFLCVFSSCGRRSEHSNRVVVLQPFNDCPAALVTAVYNELKVINPGLMLKASIPLPARAYYLPRNRYRADSLIKYLAQSGSADTVVIGLTAKDISTTKGNIRDWGIMGLALRPGNACVVSCFRLTNEQRQEQFYKVAIHELGHTQGLPHCSVKTCFMRDAEGHNHLDEETGFCKSCKTFLVKSGWKLK